MREPETRLTAPVTKTEREAANHGVDFDQIDIVGSKEYQEVRRICVWHEGRLPAVGRVIDRMCDNCVESLRSRLIRKSGDKDSS